MDSLLLDLRFGWRRLVREPRLAVAVILMIALGIGSSAAIFTIVNGVLLQPMVLPGADRVVAVHRLDSREGDLSQPDAADIRQEARSLAAFGVAATGWSLDMLVGGEPVHLAGALTEAGYFKALGLPSVEGRLLLPSDDAPGAPAVAVLGENFWRTRFGGDRSVVGRTITISDVPTTIVGIAPARADVFDAGVDAWVTILPFAAWGHESRGSNNFAAMARLAPGTSLRSANEELKVVTQRLEARYPDTNHGKILTLTPLQDFLVSDVKRGLWLLLGAVLLVLLISTANVATLLLLRASARMKEVGVRQALGAAPWRIARQLLTEGVLLSLVGGTVGVTVAWIGFGALKRFMPASLPRLEETGPDLRVLLFSLALSIVTGIGFSLAPVLRLRGNRSLMALGLARGVIRGGGRRLLAPLVVGEIALALVLLAGAALLLRSFTNLLEVPLGFDPKGVAVGEVVLPESRYAEPARQTAAFRRMVEVLREKPGITDAAFLVGRPQGAAAIGHGFTIEGRTYAPGDEPGARYRPYLGNIFDVLGIRLLRGRIPVEREGGLHEAVVNERFVERHLAGVNPIGVRFAWRAEAGKAPVWTTIVGVAQNIKSGAIRENDSPAVYAPYLQREDDWIRFGTLLAKVDGAPATYRQTLQDAVSASDAMVPLESFTTLQAEVDQALAADRFSLRLVSLFGIIALILSMQGIFSVVSYDVEQRRAELSLRMALGARSSDVLGLVLRRGTQYALGGLLLGGAGAVALTRTMDSLLYETSTQDPIALGGAAIVLGLVCVTAVTFAGLRVTRLDPASVLASDT
jgi:putative ABC transport system permease protein